MGVPEGSCSIRETEQPGSTTLHFERNIPFDADVVKMADVLSCCWLAVGVQILRFDI